MRNLPEQVAAELGLPPRVFAVFGMSVGVPDPAGETGVKPRLPRPVVLHREQYAGGGREAEIARYNATVRGFQREQGMREQDWTQQSIDRVKDAAALRKMGYTGSGITINMNCNRYSDFTVGATGIFFEFDSGTLNANIVRNAFANMNDTSTGISYTGLSSQSGSVTVTDCYFTGTNNVSGNGYAANFQMLEGALCLKFTDNFATSPTSFDPYVFQQNNPSVFNLTPHSDNSTNIGAFAITGTLGSCRLKK